MNTKIITRTACKCLRVSTKVSYSASDAKQLVIDARIAILVDNSEAALEELSKALTIIDQISSDARDINHSQYEVVRAALGY